MLAELESGLLDPEQLDGDLALLYASYRAELDRLGLWDRDLLRRRAVERLRSELGAWDGRPVFAYGFEDLTGVEWGLLEALTGRAEVTVSLPYEPARAAFASLRRTQEDLASLAAGSIEELPARSAEYGHAALAHLERHLFADSPPNGPELDGAIRFFEGAGARGSLELVAEDVRELAAAGVPLEEIALVVPSVERWRAPLETVLGTLGIPFAVEGRVRLGQTAFGQALLSLLRFEWQAGRPPAALRLPPLAVLGLRPLECRLLGGQAARPWRRRPRERRGGDDPPPRRPAAAAARGAAGCRRAGRGGSCDRHGDAAERARVGRAAGRRREPGRPALVRVARPGAGRARRLGRPRRRTVRGRGARRARARRGQAGLSRRAWPRRRPRSCPRPDASLRRRLPARPRRGDAAAPRRRLAVPRRRRARRPRPSRRRPG